ncbi:MAG: class I SAM-dependent methyltransferase [Candidatus Omnitrophica bacterium]|nr:class I SAM-dependent methyltransferase [Candidatus Omnitrophota bacterium]
MDSAPREKILDVACGAVKHAGATGIDIAVAPGVDVVHDLGVFPWPLDDNAFDRILCRNCMEHLDDIVRTMEEIHRIAKPDGILEIWTPHFAHPNSFRDPTHKRHFTFGTFDYFTGGVLYPIYTDRKFEMIERKLMFRKKFSIGKLLSSLSERRWEKYYSHHWPAHGMYFKIRIKK